MASTVLQLLEDRIRQDLAVARVASGAHVVGDAFGAQAEALLDGVEHLQALVDHLGPRSVARDDRYPIALLMCRS